MTHPNARIRWGDLAGDKSEGCGARILVVDDNDALRYSVMRSLREAGYEVVEARSGQEALVRAGELPDLITLDINLPDMDGFRVCRQLKSSSATSHIPILHLSSTFVDPESRVMGLRGGADAYLAEPIDRAELVATVGALLRLKNAETRARQQAEAAENARKELAQLNETLENRVRERTTELKTANDSLRQLSAHLLQMQDEERRRLARELHDSVGQLLVAITMNNALISNETAKLSAPAAQALSENSSMVEDVLRGIRTISHLLHPPLLDEAGLASALRWYVDEFSKRSGIHVSLDCPEVLDRLSSDLETAIFRIVQECLGNVHRHSGSRSAAIRYEVNDGKAFLQISDAGVGISAARQQEIKSHGRMGVGLRGIRERVTRFGGEFEIQSSDKGTTVTVAIPYKPVRPEGNESEAAAAKAP